VPTSQLGFFRVLLTEFLVKITDFSSEEVVGKEFFVEPADPLSQNPLQSVSLLLPVANTTHRLR
jgi:hypothetical protein